MDQNQSLLFYCSLARNRRGHTSDIEIFRASRQRNEANGITGFLLRTNDAFFQVIEGPDANVDAIFASIHKDPRHRNVRHWKLNDHSDRLFPKWWMGTTNLPKKSQRRFEAVFSDESVSPHHKVQALKYHAENLSDALE